MERLKKSTGGLCAAAFGLAGLALVGCGGEGTTMFENGVTLKGCPDEPGIACTIAGTGELGYNGEGNPALDTIMYWPFDIEFAPGDGTPYIVDWNNHRIRRLDPDGTIQTVVGDFVGDGDPDKLDLTEQGAPGLDVNLNHPTDIQFDKDGVLIIAAWHNHKIRTYNPKTDLVHVMVGRGAGFAGDGLEVDQHTRLNQPKSLVLTEDGTLYILDQRNQRIRVIDADDVISTIAGDGVQGYIGDGGPPAEAELDFETGANPEPSGGLAVGPDGNLYVADGLNHCIRRIDLENNVINTVVGSGEPGFAGDGGSGLGAKLNHPRDVEFGPDGRLYIADTENHRIRAWDPDSDVITTVAGTGETGPLMQGVPAEETPLYRPMGVAFDADGTMYIADTFNSRILRVPR